MYQQSSYGECLVHRRNTLAGTFIRFILIAVMVTSITGMLVFFSSSAITLLFISFIFFSVDLFLVIYMFPRFTVDWEYVFVDGQIDFDQILGGNARRNKDRIDFEKMEAAAPTGSHHLDSFNSVEMKTLDYSSLSGKDTFTLICHKDDAMVRILFEPDEAMINLMKQKSPRKVFTD